MSTLPREAWRPVVGHEKTYSVSSLGRVRRDAPAHGARPGRVLTAWAGRGGRKMVTLSTGNVRSAHSVHRLVALAFLGPCPDGVEVNHIDGDPTNNVVPNLEYVTRAENMAHAAQLGLTAAGERHGLTEMTNTRARRIRLLATRYDNKTLSTRLGISESAIGRLVRGETFMGAGGPIQRRTGRGSTHHNAKLTEANVREARSRFAQGETLASIAREFGVTDGAIRGIVRRRTWRHI